jgi:hypothetical protein
MIGEVVMDFETDIDWDEAFEFLPGAVVELNAQPGMVYTIERYEPMMVPPVWLVDDPRPRYPHELRIISKQAAQVCVLEPQFALA